MLTYVNYHPALGAGSVYTDHPLRLVKTLSHTVKIIAHFGHVLPDDQL